MRGWIAVLAVTAGCASTDSPPGDDNEPGDTDADTDTDQPADTDTPGTTPVEDCRPFEECGGDVVGDWSFDHMCFPALPNPLEGLCKASTYDAAIQVDGTFNVVDGGTFTFTYNESTVETYGFPAACNEGFPDCSTYDAITGLTCTGDVAVICTCVDASATYPFTNAGQWHYQGDNVVFQNLVEEGGTGDSGPIKFCQDGDEMSFMMQVFPIQLDFSR